MPRGWGHASDPDRSNNHDSFELTDEPGTGQPPGSIRHHLLCPATIQGLDTGGPRRWRIWNKLSTGHRQPAERTDGETEQGTDHLTTKDR